MIIDGKIKLKSGSPIKKFTETGVIFEDGSKLDADVFNFATGYGDPRNPMRDILGPELGKKLTPVWGIDEEGEIQSAWKEVGIEKEIESFLQAIDGSDDGVDHPRSTLVDVAFIEAALNSNGAPVDLVELSKV